MFVPFYSKTEDPPCKNGSFWRFVSVIMISKDQEMLFKNMACKNVPSELNYLFSSYLKQRHSAPDILLFLFFLVNLKNR